MDWNAVLIWGSREVERDFDRLPGQSPTLWKKTSLTPRPRLTAEPSWGIWFTQYRDRHDIWPPTKNKPARGFNNQLLPQRGAAAAEGSRRDKCVRFKLGAVSRRAERGDFVALGGEASGISGRTVQRQKSRTKRSSAISAQTIRYYSPKAALL